MRSTELHSRSRSVRHCSVALVMLCVALPASSQKIEATGETVPDQTDASADRRIEERLSAIFSSLEALESVKVSVQSGVVELQGEVLDADDRELAGTLAKQVEGVVVVENNLAESSGVRRRLAAVLGDLETRLERWIAFLPLLLIAVLVFAAFAAGARLVGRSQRLFAWATENVFLRDLASQFARGGILVAGLLLSLEILGATTLMGAVLGTAGVVGLAVGFAFRDLVENYIASILLSLRRPFAPNDHVVIEGHEGRVVRLTSRATVLLGFDGNHIRIPNGSVFKGTIVNFSRKPERRFDFAIGLGVEEDLAAAQTLAAETLRGLEGVLREPEPFALIESLGESTVDVRVFGWIDQRKTDWGRLRSEAIRRVKEAFDGAGLEMPEPIHRVRLERNEDRRRSSTPVQAPQTRSVDTSAERHLEREVLQERAAEAPDLLERGGATE